MAQRGRRQTAQRQSRQRGGSTKVKRLDNEGIIPVLARAVREVEQAAERGKVMPHGRATFQVVALLVREERARRATTWYFVRVDGDTAPRCTAVSTSRTARASTGMMPSLSRGRPRRCRVDVRRPACCCWPCRAKTPPWSARSDA